MSKVNKSSSALSGKRRSRKGSLHKNSTDLNIKHPSFINDFLKKFDPNVEESLPVIFIQNMVFKLGKNSDELPIININYSSDLQYSTIKCRNYQITLKLLTDIHNSFNNLKELKLEFCALSSDHLSNLQQLLKENGNLINLSIDGNSVTKIPDFSCLFQENNLKIISMQFCDIDFKSADLIAKELMRTDSKIISLNLACNHIESSGAKSLATTLRSNRTLKALNIADNKISEEGLTALFHIFQAFALEMHEIVFRRKEIFESLSKAEGNIVAPFKQSFSNMNKKTSSLLLKKNSETSSKKSIKIGNKSINIDIKSLNLNHPFINDSEPKNNEIICSGNNSMRHLNIAYNQITEVVLQNIKQCIEYQKVLNKSDENKGLARVIIEGNGVEKYKSLVEEITQLLIRTKRNSLSSSKRSNSSFL